jgi:hypothetical protein
MNVNSTTGLYATLVESSARLIHQRRNTITLLFEKQNIMLICKFATFGCSICQIESNKICFSSGLGIWAVMLQTEVTPMQ